VTSSSWRSRIAPWLELMSQTITIEPYLGSSAKDVPTFGPAKTFKCRTVMKSRNVLGRDGQEVVSRGYAIIGSIDPMTVNDRITLGDDGSQAVVLNLNPENDEIGPLYTRLDFQ